MSKTKFRIEIYEAMVSGGGYVSTEWAMKNILNMSKEELRRYRIKKIFNG